jgi:hypothetical protein
MIWVFKEKTILFGQNWHKSPTSTLTPEMFGKTSKMPKIEPHFFAILL